MTDITDNLDATQSISYSFDTNGNQLSKPQNSVTTNFIYDARDHLRKVTTGGSTVGQFLYDPQGLRIEKTGDRAVERYRYDVHGCTSAASAGCAGAADDQSVLTQMDAGNNTLAKYDYGPNRLLSLTNTSGIEFYLTDALNSVVNLAKTNGAIQARYQYDAWGNTRHQAGDSWNRFGFTGHEHDTETGLIYAKARYYDPETARFLSKDPWEGDLNTPPSLHKYLYAYMNPTVYVDPDGRTAICTDGNGGFGNCGGSYTTPYNREAKDRMARMDENRESQAATSAQMQLEQERLARQDEYCSNAGCQAVQQDPEQTAVIQGQVNSNTGFANESASAPGSEVDDIYQDANRPKQAINQALKGMGEVADATTTALNPAKAGFEAYQDAKGLVQIVKDNPELSLTGTALVSCLAYKPCRTVYKRNDSKRDNAAPPNPNMHSADTDNQAGSMPYSSKPAKTPVASAIPESYMRSNQQIDMRTAPASSGKNAAGYPRNGPWFWRQMLKQQPELFDAANKARIRAGQSPIVNEQWVKNVPEHQSFVGEKLVHHHIDQGPIATPLPEPVHQAWHKALHPN